MEERARAWLQNHGYAFAKVQATRQVDSNRWTSPCRVEPGPAAAGGTRLASMAMRSVSDQVVLRELPFRSGEWYSAEDLAEGGSAPADRPVPPGQLNVDFKQPNRHRGGCAGGGSRRRSPGDPRRAGIHLRGSGHLGPGPVDPPELHRGRTEPHSDAGGTEWNRLGSHPGGEAASWVAHPHPALHPRAPALPRHRALQRIPR